MPHPDYVTCKRCKRHKTACGPLSWTRLCESCALAAVEANNDQIAARQGPYFEHLQRRRIMAARKALLASERQAG